MKPLLLHPINWKDYSLVDSGDGKKLERFGNFLFIRPEPQALWSPKLPIKEWEKSSILISTTNAVPRKPRINPNHCREVTTSEKR